MLRFILGLFLAGAYSALFVRIPEIDFAKSVYYVECSQAGVFVGYSNGTFIDRLTSDNVKVTPIPGRQPRDWGFLYADVRGDAMAKLECTQGYRAQDPQTFYQQNIADASPLMLKEINEGKPNYVIGLDTIAYAPPRWLFILNIAVASLLLFCPYFIGKWHDKRKTGAFRNT